MALRQSNAKPMVDRSDQEPQSPHSTHCSYCSFASLEYLLNVVSGDVYMRKESVNKVLLREREAITFPGNVFPGNVFPGNVFSGKRLSGKVTFRETTDNREVIA